MSRRRSYSVLVYWMSSSFSTVSHQQELIQRSVQNSFYIIFVLFFNQKLIKNLSRMSLCQKTICCDILKDKIFIGLGLHFSAEYFYFLSSSLAWCDVSDCLSRTEVKSLTSPTPPPLTEQHGANIFTFPIKHQIYQIYSLLK